MTALAYLSSILDSRKLGDYKIPLNILAGITPLDKRDLDKKVEAMRNDSLDVLQYIDNDNFTCVLRITSTAKS